ncbi:MAG: hypothetical protein EXR17_03965 [Flavobacteriaceae bacterium]|nr:hypothetical protein [Flavobacteriaceae bacterium]
MSNRRKKFLLRLLLFLGIVRWYNLLLIVLSQYLLWWLAFSTNGIRGLFYDGKLHCIVFASLFSVSAAFIINAFYDVNKDLVNKPKSVIIGRYLGERKLLNAYVFLNVLAMVFAFFASIKCMLFFGSYTIFCWLYSHKLQKLPLIREVSATLIALFPLLAIWFHFDHWHWGMFYYMGSLLILLFTREIIKDITGHKGNLVFGYQTLLVAYGFNRSRLGLAVFNTGIFLAFSLLYFLQKSQPILPSWHPDYYYFMSGITLGVCFLVSWALFLFSNIRSANKLDAVLKFAIVLHLLSIIIKVNIPTFWLN